MPRYCPLCGLICSETAQTCDCGYSFAQASTVGQFQLSDAAGRNMLIGGFICVVGLVGTALTLAASQVTGIAIVAWGAIVFGGAQFVRGLLQARRHRGMEQLLEATSELDDEESPPPA